MTQPLRRIVLITSAVLFTGCVATVGHSGSVTVPKEAPQTCASSCAEMGMVLSSVVIMANNVGCVCSPKANPAADNGAAASAGMVTLLMQEAEAEAQQQQAAAR